MRYLCLSSKPLSASSFPCHLDEIVYALKEVTQDRYLESWPTYGHGPEWRMLSNRPGKTEFGIMVLDLENEGRIMTIAELTDLGVVWKDDD